MGERWREEWEKIVNHETCGTHEKKPNKKQKEEDNPLSAFLLLRVRGYYLLPLFKS